MQPPAPALQQPAPEATLAVAAATPVPAVPAVAEPASAGASRGGTPPPHLGAAAGGDASAATPASPADVAGAAAAAGAAAPGSSGKKVLHKTPFQKEALEAAFSRAPLQLAALPLPPARPYCAAAAAVSR
jgi:hypothetical protein